MDHARRLDPVTAAPKFEFPVSVIAASGCLIPSAVGVFDTRFCVSVMSLAHRVGTRSPLIKSLCRRGRVIVAEDKARDRVESGDSGSERNAVSRPQGPDAARMGFFNGLLEVGERQGGNSRSER